MFGTDGRGVGDADERHAQLGADFAHHFRSGLHRDGVGLDEERLAEMKIFFVEIQGLSRIARERGGAKIGGGARRGCRMSLTASTRAWVPTKGQCGSEDG